MRQVVGVEFNAWDRKSYDYFCDFEVAPGDKAVVQTSRGEAEVTVISVKQNSEKATAAVLRVIPKAGAAA